MKKRKRNKSVLLNILVINFGKLFVRFYEFPNELEALGALLTY